MERKVTHKQAWEAYIDGADVIAEFGGDKVRYNESISDSTDAARKFLMSDELFIVEEDTGMGAVDGHSDQLSGIVEYCPASWQKEHDRLLIAEAKRQVAEAMVRMADDMIDPLKTTRANWLRLSEELRK